MNFSALCLSLFITPLGAPAPRGEQASLLKQIPILSIDLIIPTPSLTNAVEHQLRNLAGATTHA